MMKLNAYITIKENSAQENIFIQNKRKRTGKCKKIIPARGNYFKERYAFKINTGGNI